MTGLVLLLGALAPVAPAGAAGGVGAASAEFLEIAASTRAAGMGEAFVGIADDVGALYHNPAGMVRNRESSLQYLHAAWLGTVGYDHLAGMFPHTRWGSVGASFSRLLLSQDRINVGPSGEPVIQPGGLQASQNAAAVSYAVPVAVPTAVGLTLKVVGQDLDVSRGTAVAADLGLQYRSPLPELVLGAQLANVGTRLDRASLPVVLKAGGGLSLPAVPGLAALAGRRGSWDLPVIAAELHFRVAPQTSRFVTLRTGLEYRVGIDDRQAAHLRMGYKYGEEGAGGFAGATLGMGYRLGLQRFSFGLDYALVHYGELGPAHRFEVTMGFSPVSRVSFAGMEAARKAAKQEGQVYLTWSRAAEPGVTGYNVYMGESKDAEFGKVNREGTVPGTSLAIRGLTVGKTYHFFVTPVTGVEPAVEGRPFFEASLAAQAVP